MTSKEIEEVARTLYTKVYGEKSVDDCPVAQQALNGIKKSDHIRTVPIQVHHH